MIARRTWTTVFTAGVATATVAGAILLTASARAADDEVEVAAGSTSPAAGAPTLVAADERGRIVELSADDGTEVAVLADETTTGGSVTSLTVSDDRTTVFFASHDPLLGLPCDATVVELSVADGRTTTLGPGFAPALSPDGGRLAYVATDTAASGCTYAARVRDLDRGVETDWGLEAEWAEHYGICSLAWEPGASALVAQACHGADTVLHRVALDRPGTIGDLTYLGPGDPERSWTAVAPGADPGTVMVVERCCISADPLEPSHRLVAIDATSGEVAEARGELPGTIESVAQLDTGAGGDLLLTASTFTGDGSTERQLLRWTGGEAEVLGRGFVAAAW